MRVEVNKDGFIEVFADENDTCYACDNIYKCPLIQALQAETVILHYSVIDVLKCGLFKSYPKSRGKQNVKNQN